MKPLLCSCRIQLALVCVMVTVTLIFLVSSPIKGFVSTLREISNYTHPDCNRIQPSRCDFPLVYNKPPKTAGTKIRDDLAKWSSTVRRRVYRCSPYTRQAMFQMRECIPEDKSGCAIVANHMKLSHTLRELLTSRIGEFKLLTSTRNPPDRIFSMFMQVERTRARKLGADVLRNSSALRGWLAQYNPWDLYNYHSGEGREGSCPLSLQDISTITNLVNRVDIVIDMDFPKISNAILKHSNLFPLSESILNHRTGGDINVTILDMEIQEMIKSVSCVEDEMHRMFRLRMASMYQKATGIQCLSNSRFPTPTCFDPTD